MVEEQDKANWVLDLEISAFGRFMKVGEMFEIFDPRSEVDKNDLEDLFSQVLEDLLHEQRLL